MVSQTEICRKYVRKIDHIPMRKGKMSQNSEEDTPILKGVAMLASFLEWSREKFLIRFLAVPS